MNNFSEGLKVGQQALINLVTTAFHKLGGFVPSLLGAILLLVVGWLIAASLKKLSHHLFKFTGINYLIEHSGVNDFLEKLGFKRKAEDILTSLVYLIVLLIFITAATEILGIRIVIETINKFISYIPQVFGALFIFIFLSYIGKFICQSVSNFLRSYHLEYAAVIGKIIEILIIIFALVIAIKELGFETSIFTANISLIIGIIFGAIGLSIGWGTRDIAKKVVSGLYLRKNLNIGDEIQIKDVKGQIISFENTSIKIKSANEIILIPYDQILESQVQIIKK